MALRVSPKQRLALDNLHCGRPMFAGLCGHNGEKVLMQALLNKGLIDDHGITALGRAAIGIFF